ncbi:hypothetical protein [Treponema sp.]|uniref:hypothetical protein n=1 Tax=Treponema sp. TaxID=166 RepID=UPI0025E74AE2|nr:hypothetical protein [Treponema sp.]MBR4322817.1 hypothetical protein [Treponema sp.]
MTIFTIFNLIYWLSFATIFILASVVNGKLRSLSNQIAKTDGNSATINPATYQSTEIYLLHSSPDFPLSALIKILPGTFIGFGILGTFLGFSNGISGMRLTGNVDELFGKLDTFFLGLNTAFITSIIGVILSVLFGTILYQWPLNKIKFHCARIYSELSKTLTPAEAAKSEFDAYIGSLQEMTKTLLAAKDTIEVSLTTAVEKIESLPEKFLAVGKSLEESVAPVKDTFSAMQTTLENYSKQADSLRNASEQIQQTLTKFIETSEQTTEKISGTLNETISATKEIQENNSKLNTQILTDQKTVLEDYQKIDENISSILEIVNKNLADYSAIVEKSLVETLEEYNKTAQKVTESFFGQRKEA